MGVAPRAGGNTAMRVRARAALIGGMGLHRIGSAQCVPSEAPPEERRFPELRRFQAQVLIGGVPARNLKGVPALLRVHDGAWRLDIRLPQSAGQARSAPVSATILRDPRGKLFQ